jgi:2-isopropylmalate synthase
VTIVGQGNGPIDAFVHALRDSVDAELNVLDYAEHAIGQGSEANAVAYVETSEDDGKVLWGVGVDPNIITASLRAVLNAHERHQL